MRSHFQSEVLTEVEKFDNYPGTAIKIFWYGRRSELTDVAHPQFRIIFCNFFYGEPVGYLLLLTRLTLGLSRRVPMLMGRPKLKPTEKKRPVGFAISPDLYRRLAAFAKREKRSISSAAEVLLSKILEDKNAIK